MWIQEIFAQQKAKWKHRKAESLHFVFSAIREVLLAASCLKKLSVSQSDAYFFMAVLEYTAKSD